MSEDKKIHRAARLRTIRLDQIRVNPIAQREHNEARVAKIADNLDHDRLGTLTVSSRDGWYWLLDGQHRFYGLRENLRRTFGDEWAEWEIPVWCYEGLSEREEAQKFLELNEAVLPNHYDRFKVSVAADKPPAPDIDRIVRSLGLKVSRAKTETSISATTGLERIYRIGGPRLLVATLVTIRDAWEGYGYDAAIMDGVSRFIERYEGQYKPDRLISVMGALKNGSLGLFQASAVERNAMGCTRGVAMAATLVNLYNKGLRGNGRLTSWWKYEAGESEAASA